MAETLCGAGGIFSRCKNQPVQTCQYCGRPFCSAHTYHMEGHEAVCTRRLCRAKQDDMAVHLEYRALVQRRNSAGLCGIESCERSHPSGQCSMCQGTFCEEHVAERMYPFRDGRVVISRPASVCRRCWDRRKIWRR